MKTTAIIAEYNPFHTGHAYQIEKARELTDADRIVVILSPDFVQRGTPALTDKYTRTKMALEGGADLVLELPVCCATGSAEFFASGAIRILEGLGCVDSLSFGCESDHLASLSLLSAILQSEPPRYRETLKAQLASGCTFPHARETALAAVLSHPEELPAIYTFAASGPTMFKEIGETHKEYTRKLEYNHESVPSKDLYKNLGLDDPNLPEYCSKNLHTLLNGSNNILALEYLKALRRYASTIKPAPVLRQGSDYHEDTPRIYASAQGIRAMLSSQKQKEASTYLLPETQDILFKSLGDHPVKTEIFDRMLHYRLLSRTDFTDFLDVTSDLNDRLLNLLPQYETAAQFTELVKTRQMTHTRISRALLHIFLGIRETQTQAFFADEENRYVRILGFRRESTDLLAKIKKSTCIPVISKNADAEKILRDHPVALESFRQDLNASHLYQLLCQRKDKTAVVSEYTKSPIIL